MAQITFSGPSERQLGYTRSRRRWHRTAGLPDVTVTREPDDPAQGLRMVVTTEPEVTLPAVVTLEAGKSTASTITNKMKRSVRPTRLAGFESAEGDAHLDARVYAGEALVGSGTMEFEIEAWNEAPRMAPRGDDAEAAERRRESICDWARFVTPEAAIVHHWAREVARRGKAKKRKIQHDPRWTLRAALRAIGAMEWAYATRNNLVYPPERLAARGSGNCVESSVATASLLLALGHHPLLVLIEKHMQCGVWIRGRPVDKATFTCGAEFRDAVRAGAIDVAETTWVYHDRSRRPRAMVRAGRKSVLKKDPTRFEAALDIEEAHWTHPPVVVPAQC